MYSHPSPNPNPLLIYIMFPSPDPVNCDKRDQCQLRISDNSPCGVYLIPSLKKSEVVPHRVPQLPALETRTARVNDHHNVLVIRGEDRVPISVKPDVDLLCAWTVVPND